MEIIVCIISIFHNVKTISSVRKYHAGMLYYNSGMLVYYNPGMLVYYNPGMLMY